MAKGTIPLLTAAAEPPEEPPATLSKSTGFLVVKKAEFSVEDPIPNSSRLVFPINIAPCFFNFSTIVASKLDS